MGFPLGVPTNRPPPAPPLVPIEGRPNWFRDKDGREIYVEPNKRPQQQGGGGDKP